jgi:hypothetical protein
MTLAPAVPQGVLLLGRGRRQRRTPWMRQGPGQVRCSDRSMRMSACRGRCSTELQVLRTCALPRGYGRKAQGGDIHHGRVGAGLTLTLDMAVGRAVGGMAGAKKGSTLTRRCHRVNSSMHYRTQRSMHCQRQRQKKRKKGRGSHTPVLPLWLWQSQ